MLGLLSGAVLRSRLCMEAVLVTPAIPRAEVRMDWEAGSGQK